MISHLKKKKKKKKVIEQKSQEFQKTIIFLFS